MTPLRPKLIFYFFFQNSRTAKFGMTKKNMPKSQAKTQTIIPVIPFFNHFLTLKMYYGNIVTGLRYFMCLDQKLLDL